MPQIFKMENIGYSDSALSKNNNNNNNSNELGMEGLCFGYSALWALSSLLTNQKWQLCNPTKDQSKAKKIQNKFEANLNKKIDKNANKLQQHGELLQKAMVGSNEEYEAWVKRNNKIKKKLNDASDPDKYYQNVIKATASLPFTLQLPIKKDAVRLPWDLHGNDKTYLIDIGGHWLGIYLHSQSPTNKRISNFKTDDLFKHNAFTDVEKNTRNYNGHYAYFDPNGGCWFFRSLDEIGYHHIINMYRYWTLGENRPPRMGQYVHPLKFALRGNQ